MGDERTRFRRRAGEAVSQAMRVGTHREDFVAHLVYPSYSKQESGTCLKTR